MITKNSNIPQLKPMMNEAVISHLYTTNDPRNYNVSANLKNLMKRFNDMSDEELIQAIGIDTS